MTNNTQATDFIKLALAEKKAKNPSYSLSAMARDLNLSQPHLSKIMSGERRLTPERAYKIGKFLKLNEKQFFSLIISTLESENEQVIQY